MHRTPTRAGVAALTLLLALPGLAEAGPPLICNPFDPGQAEVLPWGTGPGWNTPDTRYDLQRLIGDTLRLLTPEAPVIARMENMRRATIYAARDQRVAKALLDAVTARAATATNPHALFDAGYLIETYKQAGHLHRWPAPTADGRGMVRRAIALIGANRDMQYASTLMSTEN